MTQQAKPRPAEVPSYFQESNEALCIRCVHVRVCERESPTCRMAAVTGLS